MSVCFYDNRGLMSGVDIQTFMVVGPGLAAVSGIPIDWGYVVAAPNFWPPAYFWKRCGTVTSDGWKMIQSGFALRLVPHVPVPGPPPAPTQAVNLAGIIIASKSSPTMTAHSVTGEGQKLAVCVAGSFGINKNCSKAIVGLVSNPNSVVTTPSVGDYVAAVVGVALGKAIPNVSLPIPFLAGFIKKKIIGFIKGRVQKYTDEAWSALDGF